MSTEERRTIAAIDRRAGSLDLTRRELVVVAVALVAFSRFVAPADAFLVAGLLPVVILVAGN